MQKAKIWFCVSAFLYAAPALAQNNFDQKARLAAAREMVMTREREVDIMISTLSRHYMAQIKRARPQLKDSQISAIKILFENNLRATKADYINRQIDIFARNYSVAELQSVNAFYKTGIGKKMLETLPTVYPELADAEVDWSSAAASKAIASINSPGKPAQ